jgi:hypothetical protein
LKGHCAAFGGVVDSTDPCEYALRFWLCLLGLHILGVVDE